MYGHSFRAMFEQLLGYCQPASRTDRPKRDEAELQRCAGVAWVLLPPRLFWSSDVLVMGHQMNKVLYIEFFIDMIVKGIVV